MLKFNCPGDIHFVTFKTANNRAYFKDERCCEILLEELNFYRDKYCLKIFGYVIMPDHFHGLFYFDRDNLTISKIIQSIKGVVAKKIIDSYVQMGRQEHPLLAGSSRLEPMLQSTRGLRGIRTIPGRQEHPLLAGNSRLEPMLQVTQEKPPSSLFPGRQEHPLLAGSSRPEPMLQATRGALISRSDNKGHKRGLKYRVWQPGFYDFNIYTDKKFQEKLNYINLNPIKHGLVSDISQYKYCSWQNYEFDNQGVFKIDYLEY